MRRQFYSILVMLTEERTLRTTQKVSQHRPQRQQLFSVLKFCQYFLLIEQSSVNESLRISA